MICYESKKATPIQVLECYVVGVYTYFMYKRYAYKCIYILNWYKLYTRSQEGSNYNSTCHLAFNFECHGSLLLNVFITLLFCSTIYWDVFGIHWIQMKTCTHIRIQNTWIMYLIT